MGSQCRVQCRSPVAAVVAVPVDGFLQPSLPLRPGKPSQIIELPGVNRIPEDKFVSGNERVRFNKIKEQREVSVLILRSSPRYLLSLYLRSSTN
jgi:hypothetical protein